MSQRPTFNPRAHQQQHPQGQDAASLDGAYIEPSASTNTMDILANPNQNPFNDINAFHQMGHRQALDLLISFNGGPSQTNLGHSTSPSYTISPSILSSINTPAEHMGTSPYLPTPIDYPTSHPAFHPTVATNASGGNPSLFAHASPLVHTHPSHFVSTSTIPQWHSPTQEAILSSSVPAAMSPLHYSPSHHSQQHQHPHQQPQPRYGGGSASANTSPFEQFYHPAPVSGQVGPSLFQNTPNPILPPHPRLTNVTHSPLTSTSGGGPPLTSLTNPASLRISAAHSVEPASASTPLDGSSMSLFPLSQSSTTSSGSSSSAATTTAAGAPASEPPHAYLARNTARLTPEHRELVEKKWSVWANDPVRQRKVVDILTAWYGDQRRPSNADLMFFHRKLYGAESVPLSQSSSSHHGATSSIDSQDDVFSAPSTSAAAINPSSSAVAVGSSNSSRRGGGAGTRGGPTGYECVWPNGGCANPLKARADRIQEDALIHLGIKTHICEPCGSDFLRKNELTRHQKTCKSYNASLNTQEDPAQLNMNKGGRAKETSRKGSGPSISPIASRFPHGARKGLERSIRGISSSEPPAYSEGAATAGADSYRGGRKSLDSAVFAPMAPGGAGGDVGGSSSSSGQVSPVNTRDMPYFAGDVNGLPPTPQQPGEAPQPAQGGISLFRNNSVGRNRLVMTGANSGGDQVCKPHGRFPADELSLASSLSTLKKAGEEQLAARSSRPRPRRSNTSYHPSSHELPLAEEDEGSVSPERAKGSKKPRNGGTEDGKRRSDRGAPS